MSAFGAFHDARRGEIARGDSRRRVWAPTVASSVVDLDADCKTIYLFETLKHRVSDNFSTKPKRER